MKLSVCLLVVLVGKNGDMTSKRPFSDERLKIHWSLRLICEFFTGFHPRAPVISTMIRGWNVVNFGSLIGLRFSSQIIRIFSRNFVHKKLEVV